MDTKPRRIIVLREWEPRSASKGSGNLAPAGAIPKGTSLETSGIRTELPLTVESMEQAPRDPDAVLAHSEAMPLTAIRPVENSALIGSAVLGETVAAAQSNKVTWGIRAIGADTSQFTGKGVTVAVLDSGIKNSHQAFARLKVTGKLIEKDFTGTGDGDASGHGTHCAATIFGGEVNGVRIGVAPDIEKALIAKVLGGNADSGELIDAMKWSLDEGAQVISMSLGFDYVGYRERLVELNFPQEAATSMALSAFRDNIRLFDKFMEFASARSHEAVFTAATGNESERPKFAVAKSSPSAAVGVLSVAALGRENQDLAVATFSNQGADVSAPGVGVVSAGRASDDELVARNGTSMATPHVAGLAALHWQHLQGSMPGVSPTHVSAALTNSAILSRSGALAGFAIEDVGAGMPSAPR